MQTDIQIVQISDAVKNAETFVLVGRRDYLLSDAIYHLLPQDVQNYWETMVDACEPGDAGKSTETWRGEAGPKKVSVCVLPEACSRHNSPARPHAITHLLQSTVPANGVSAVILVIEEASHSVAAVAAAARAIPVYSRKTGVNLKDVASTCALSRMMNARSISMYCKFIWTRFGCAAALWIHPPQSCTRKHS